MKTITIKQWIDAGGKPTLVYLITAWGPQEVSYMTFDRTRAQKATGVGS